MTTKECMIALKQRAPGDDVIRWVQSFLDECDTIKFTRIEPSADRWATIWNDARLLVQMTTLPDELAGAGRPRRAAPPGGRLMIPFATPTCPAAVLMPPRAGLWHRRRRGLRPRMHTAR